MLGMGTDKLILQEGAQRAYVAIGAQWQQAQTSSTLATGPPARQPKELARSGKNSEKKWQLWAFGIPNGALGVPLKNPSMSAQRVGLGYGRFGNAIEKLP